MKPFARSRWIWNDDTATENQHVCFRTAFEYSPGGAAVLHIAADSDFVAYLNGVRVGQGQFGDWPEEKTYSTFDAAPALRPGRNVLAILAYYRGRNFSTYAPGPPGLIAELGEAVSNSGWRCRKSPAFTSGTVPITTSQMGFSAAFDARKNDDWLSPGYDDSGWESARERELRATLTPRPVPPLLHLPAIPGTVAIQGHLLRRKEGETFSVTMAADLLGSLPFREAFILPDHHGQRRPALPNRLAFRPVGDGCNGYFAIADLGAAYAGLVTFKLTAPAGTVCDIAVGEHLDDGRVRAKIGYRNFADRYICREGDNEFTFPFRRVAGRYAEIHVANMGEGAITLGYLGIVPTELELPPVAGFSSSDPLADRRYHVGCRTMELCMHEHYEDCPWREQALYAYDSRNQALYGYYRWGNYNFARASIDLLGCGFRTDGLLQLCAPCRMDLTIPAFAFVWVAEMAEYELHSGDLTLFDRYRGQIEAMIGKVLDRFDAAAGLFRLHGEPHHWHFYEWTAGLDGNSDNAKTGIHAAFNLYFYEMLGSYLDMLARRNEENRDMAAHRHGLGAGIHRNFWNGKFYAAILDNGVLRGAHEHIQALALYNRIVPEPLIPAVVNALLGRTLSPISFSAMSYLVRGLMPLGREARREVEGRLAEAFNPLILSGASTLWETPLGANDFSGAGSLCHAWSSIDVYFDHAEVLGIKPLAPGFTRFAIAPYFGHFKEAKGSVATPYGPIEVEWKGMEYTATGPEQLKPELRMYPEAKFLTITYNGRELR